MTSRVKKPPPPPPTDQERAAAARSAAAIRLAIADPAAAGERVTAHLLLARPRRGLWLRTWSNLPGLTFHVTAGGYTHDLLPGWQYTGREVRTEMIADLEHLAATGERPTEATNNA